MSGRKLYAVDKAVWHVRRYCADWRRLERHIDGTYSEVLDIPLHRIESSEYEREPHRFRLPLGVLEELVDADASPLREDLTWNNKYFGAGAADPEIYIRGASANPALVLNPAAFAELDRLVHFSGEFRRRFASRSAPNSRLQRTSARRQF